MSSEIEIETIPGIPGELPAGEHVLWQGKPTAGGLARSTFKLRGLVFYFAIFIGVRVVMAIRSHEGLHGVSESLLAVLAAGSCIGMLYGIAWLHARAAIYTITNRRIVLRIGIAIPMTWNLPFKRLASADLAVRNAADGDIVLQLTEPNRIAWLHLWPHVAPGNIVKARPTLRAISAPAHVAAILSDAVAASTATVLP